MENDQQNGRQNGRFAKGNPGGPGRPPASSVDRLGKELDIALTGCQWAMIAYQAGYIDRGELRRIFELDREVLGRADRFLEAQHDA